MISGKNVVIAAGGTAGHINAALALGQRIEELGGRVTYLSGKRYLDYDLYKDKNAIHIDSYPLKLKNPFKIVFNILRNIHAFFSVLMLVRKLNPIFMFGAGGYVCGPSLLAGYIIRVPVYILEQNSVFGLTNRILAYLARIVFVNFKNTKNLSDSLKHKIDHSGNPIRKEFMEQDFTHVDKNHFQILIFGGSLGSRDINDVAKKLVQQPFCFPVKIIHQVGKTNQVMIDAKRIARNVEYIQKAYIENIYEEYRNCDLVICRSGASTVSELEVVQRTSILIPLTIHKDKHQVLNAKNIKSVVQFDVYILNSNELTDDNCKLLCDIVNKEYEKLNKRAYKRVQVKDSVSHILVAIEKNLSTH